MKDERENQNAVLQCLGLRWLLYTLVDLSSSLCIWMRYLNLKDTEKLVYDTNRRNVKFFMGRNEFHFSLSSEYLSAIPRYWLQNELLNISNPSLKRDRTLCLRA